MLEKAMGDQDFVHATAGSKRVHRRIGEPNWLALARLRASSLSSRGAYFTTRTANSFAASVNSRRGADRRATLGK